MVCSQVDFNQTFSVFCLFFLSLKLFDFDHFHSEQLCSVSALPDVEPVPPVALESHH